MQTNFIMQLADDSRDDLHAFLTLHADVLDSIDIWSEIRDASAAPETWEAYGA